MARGEAEQGWGALQKGADRAPAPKGAAAAAAPDDLRQALGRAQAEAARLRKRSRALELELERLRQAIAAEAAKNSALQAVLDTNHAGRGARIASSSGAPAIASGAGEFGAALAEAAAGGEAAGGEAGGEAGDAAGTEGEPSARPWLSQSFRAAQSATV